MIKTTSKLLFIVLLAMIMTACGSTVKKTYTNPKFSVADVDRIAIMPFDGVREANTAADMISMVLANSDSFESVVDRTQLKAVLSEHSLPSELLNPTTLIQKSQFIHADALLTGRVTQFYQGHPAYPVATRSKISMSLKLVSAETGQIIWTRLYSKSSRGAGIFAANVDKMMIDMAEKIARDLAKLK